MEEGEGWCGTTVNERVGECWLERKTTMRWAKKRRCAGLLKGNLLDPVAGCEDQGQYDRPHMGP